MNVGLSQISARISFRGSTGCSFIKSCLNGGYEGASQG
jgi:hypothetical protein